jgi:hypothetical protein
MPFGLHAPEPSQIWPSMTVPLHVAIPHEVPALAVWLQEPEPLHVPSGPQGLAESTGQPSL